MPTLWIPVSMRDLTDGKDAIRVSGKTVGEALANLDAIYPGVRSRLCQEDDLSPHIAVVVNGDVSEMGIYHPLEEDSEVHFLPAMEGG